MKEIEQSLLSTRLKLLRHAGRMTQKDVSDMLDVSRSAYTYYERDRSKPDFDTLITLSKIFGVSIDYLVGLSNLPERRREEAQAADVAQNEMVREFALGQLPDEERQMLCQFRLLSDAAQEAIAENIRQTLAKEKSE